MVALQVFARARNQTWLWGLRLFSNLNLTLTSDKLSFEGLVTRNHNKEPKKLRLYGVQVSPNCPTFCSPAASLWQQSRPCRLSPAVVPKTFDVPTSGYPISVPKTQDRLSYKKLRQSRLFVNPYNPNRLGTMPSRSLASLGLGSGLGMSR